jgi:hypothetical protein
MNGFSASCSINSINCPVALAPPPPASLRHTAAVDGPQLLCSHQCPSHDQLITHDDTSCWSWHELRQLPVASCQQPGPSFTSCGSCQLPVASNQARRFPFRLLPWYGVSQPENALTAQAQTQAACHHSSLSSFKFVEKLLQEFEVYVQTPT